MTQVAPNIYRYTTKSGIRYATRVQFRGKQTWAKGFLRAAQAKAHLLEVQVGSVDAKYFPDRVPAPALHAYGHTWLRACRLRGLRRSTLRSYTQNLNDHVLPMLGTRALNAITRQDIIALLRQKQDEGYSGNSVRLMIAPLSRLYSDAVDEGIVATNPCLRPGRLLQLRKKKRESIALSIEERDSLLSCYAEHKPEHYPLASMLFKAGLRIGEAIALERTDPDLSRSALLVRFTYSNGRLEPSTKNGRYRRIDLDRDLVLVLARHMERLNTVDPKGKLLFPGKKGGYLWERSWRRWVWEPMVKTSTIRRITPHSARHTYATHKLNEGCSIQWLSAQLGHSSIQITVDTYGHMAQKQKLQFELQPPVTGSHSAQQLQQASD